MQYQTKTQKTQINLCTVKWVECDKSSSGQNRVENIRERRAVKEKMNTSTTCTCV